MIFPNLQLQLYTPCWRQRSEQTSLARWIIRINCRSFLVSPVKTWFLQSKTWTLVCLSSVNQGASCCFQTRTKQWCHVSRREPITSISWRDFLFLFHLFFFRGDPTGRGFAVSSSWKLNLSDHDSPSTLFNVSSISLLWVTGLKPSAKELVLKYML